MKQLLATAISIGVAVVCLELTPVLAQGAKVNTPDSVVAQINDVEEQFRVAKLRNNVSTLDRLLDDSFFETNQNGNSRTKTETMELFRSFPIHSLTTDSSAVHRSGQTAVVTGSQTEVNDSGTDRMLFARVYVKNADRWRLLSSTQFRNPKFREAVSR